MNLLKLMGDRCTCINNKDLVKFYNKYLIFFENKV